MGRIGLKAIATALGISTALVALPGAALADKSDDTLRIAFSKEVESVDRYFNTAREGVIMGESIWDSLVYRDPESGEYLGNLATSWTWVDDLTLEFKLREGVTFHNGEEFDADDVVYTVNFVVDPANGVINTAHTSWMKSAEKVDKFTVRLNLKSPFPAALEYLSGPVVIYPNEYYAEVGPQGMGAKPVGTGPYMVESVSSGSEVVLKRNENYFDGPKNTAKIDKVVIRFIPDVNTQLAEMFSDSLDFLWQVPADQAEQVKAQGRFDVVNEQSMRIAFLALDAEGRSSPDVPTKNLKVRQALNYAINREALLSALLKGASTRIDSACVKVQFGCEQDVTGYDYDPEKAKALLAEAGYPNGFSIDFYAYRDRNYAEAMLGMLQEVGITANLEYINYAPLREKRIKDGVPIAFLTDAFNSIADVSSVTSRYFAGGGDDGARDPQVMELVTAGDTVTDPEERKKLYSQAFKRIADEAYWVPLFTYNTNYVLSQELAFTPTLDENIRFYQMSWK
ncbi:MAG TPA: ABC transporter substrate-binding protein [Rhizobiaceae bacterium]|nr:ABC transporter substrate-binding protein [Rhizobiaceae bacterium]